MLKYRGPTSTSDSTTSAPGWSLRNGTAEHMTDDFDDVEIDSVPKMGQRRKGASSLVYMHGASKRPSDAMNRSSTSLMNNNSYEAFHERTPVKTAMTSPVKQLHNNTQSAPVSLKDSPSKRLKRNRELTKQALDHLADIDDSEDELDDSVIIYDVPLSQSLVQLATHQRMAGQQLRSFNSDTTRNSSLMSSRRSHDANSDFELDMMNDDAKRLTYEFAKSESVLAQQESAMRRHILSQLEKTKGIQDTAPHSELKQTYLSGTRPSHLPPKSKAETQRHSREVELLKAKAIKDEIKNEKRRLKEIENKVILRAQDLSTWQREIIPDFSERVKLSTTRELWWRGVPQKLRKFVWVELLEMKSMRPQLEELKKRSARLIKRDTEMIQKLRREVSAVFPDLGVFQEGQSEPLLQMLVMYTELDGNHAKGLCFLAAVLLYNIETLDEAFLSLCGLLQRPVLRSLYTDDKESFSKQYESFIRTFERLDPRLSDHLNKALQMDPQTYLSPMLMTMFANLLDMEVSSSVMDVYIFEGDSFLWRCVLDIMDKIGYRLYGDEQEVLDVIGWNALKNLNKQKDGNWVRYMDVGDSMDFLQSVRQVIKK